MSQTHHPTPTPPSLGLGQILLCSAAIVTLSMGIRHGFGLWMGPVMADRGWGRESLSLALAIQNLMWGAAGILAGMLADRWGAMRILILGGLCYALGLMGMAYSTTYSLYVITSGLVIGIAQAGTTYAIVYGVIGRQIAAERRSWAMGVAAAAGSFGQFLMVPVEGYLIHTLGWQMALAVLAGSSLFILPLAFGLKENMKSSTQNTASTASSLSMMAAIRQALGYRSFQLLMAGYFVCGFQVVFIGVHLPSYLRDTSLPASIAPQALAIIGLFNVIGTYLAGWLGQHWSKRHILAGIYAGRAITIGLFCIYPISVESVYLFSAVMGILWLSTVPPTNATIAQIFGVRHLSMLGGFVFFSHQIGSFLGVWLAGKIYDQTGNYNLMWGLAIALGVMAACVNLPINEKPLHVQGATT